MGIQSAGGRRTATRAGRWRLLGSAALLAAASWTSPLCAQTTQPDGAAATRELPFAIASQPLAGALVQFSAATGIDLVHDGAIPPGIASPGVSGRMGVQEALRRLLTGTGFTARFTSPSSATLLRLPPAPASDADAVTLPPIDVVTGQRGWEPVRGRVAAVSATGTKTDTPIVETPQTLSIIPRLRMEEQGVRNLTDALAYSPGVMPSFGGSDTRNDVVQVRGFYPRDFLDGLRLPFSAYSVAVPQIDPWMLERVELLQGPASILFGQTSPGGVINAVSRRPAFEPHHEVMLQTGNFARMQGAFDTTGALDADGRFAYRLTGLARTTGSEVDFTHDRRLLIAPAITWRPSSDTSLTLLSHFQRDDMISPYVGLPYSTVLGANPNGRLPRSRYPGEPEHDGYRRDQFGLGYAFEHRFDQSWMVRQNLRYTQVDIDGRATPGVALAADGRTLSRVATRGLAHGSIFAVDTQAQVDFTTGPLRHTVLAGVDYQHQRDQYRFSSGLASSIDLYNPVYFTVVPPLIPRLHTLQTMDQLGLYAQDQIRMGRWVLTLGGRHDWADASTRDRMAGTRVTRDDRAFSGRVGLNYVSDSGIAPYVSYATSFEPVLGTDFSGRPFEPTTGRQYEVGIRYHPPGSQTLISLAAYHLTQQNVLTPDTTPGRTNFSVQTGEVEVRGINAEARVTLSDQVDILASYAYTDSEVTRANPNAAGVSTVGRPLVRTPRHTASFWGNYRFTEGPLRGLVLGGGLRHLGSSYSDTALTIRTPAVTLFDAALHYDLEGLSPELQGVRLSVTGTNIGDRDYVSYCLSTVQCFYGTGRTVLVSLRTAF